MDKEVWNRDALTALQIVGQLRNEFWNTPAEEEWRQLFDAYQERIRNISISDSSRGVLLHIGTIGSTLFGNMPAKEKWQDAVMYIESCIDLVTKVVES